MLYASCFMIIGIDGSRAFLKQRTGIEEYSYQVIKHLREKLGEWTLNVHKGHSMSKTQVVLYLRRGQKVDFELPENWKIKKIKIFYFWTQIGLSLEMFFNKVDVLFVPAHTLPFFHPKKSIVTIHGLEFEIMPEAYSFLGRIYMRLSIKKSCFWASKVIAVSKNTKKDLINLYKIPEKKIEVIYEGVSTNYEFNTNIRIIPKTKYLLFLGRLEKRKNIEGIISAFEVLKEKYKIPHELFLVGSPGFGYGEIKLKIENSPYKKEIIQTGYVSESKKKELIKNAEVFLFPTFYEGFGLPILEAQILGVPVVTSNISSLPEVGGESVTYCTPKEPISIADSVYKLINDGVFRNDIIKKGYENVKKFSWEKCAKEISEVLVG